MKLCNPDCLPCCDFCKHAEHEVWTDVFGKHIGGPIGCKLHDDEEHQELAKDCAYCDDFICFRCG